MGLRLYLAKLWNYVVRVRPKMRGKYDVLLDLGCGMGYFCKILRKHAEYVIGMDVYIPSLKQARKTGGFDDLILADIGTLRFKKIRLIASRCLMSSNIYQKGER